MKKETKNAESRKRPYVSPTLEKRERLSDVTEGTITSVTGGVIT